MPEGPDGKTIIIVKKVSGHGGHHGGAWKVAFADFVTSMMALFMVLWLVNTASVTTRQRIASFFKRPGVFEKGSGAPIEEGGSGILPDAFAPPADANSQVILRKEIYKVDSDGGLKKQGFAGGPGSGEDGREDTGGGIGEGAEPNLQVGVATTPALKEELQKQTVVAAEAAAAAAALAATEEQALERLASDMQSTISRDQGRVTGALGEVTVKIDQRGLHLEIMDTPEASMFQRGSAGVSKEAQQELLKLANILKTLPNPIDIEGHTDSTPYRSTRQYDNWNLSTDRANAARQVLQNAGIKDWQIARVVGYGPQRPKVPENKMHPSNRRISISMRYTEQAAEALKQAPVEETETLNVKPLNADGTPVVVPPAVVQAPPVVAPVIPEKAPVATQPTPGDAEKEAAAMFEQKLSEVRGQSGLSLELNTTLPEGATVEPAESNSLPSWLEQDKIFGNDFFKVGK